MTPKAVIFDFDGVILESALIKTEAFLELFSDYPEHRQAILRHHLENQGVSRYRKFEWIYAELLGRDLSDVESRHLGDAFTKIAFERILSCPWVPGVEGLLEFLHGHCMLFVASGTPQEELERIVLARGLSRFFLEVWGTPLEKVEIIRSILVRHRLRPEDVVFIGDGLSDYHAARETGLHFYARIIPDARGQWEQLGVEGGPDLHSFHARLSRREPAREATSA